MVPHLLHPFGTFVLFPPELKPINCGIYKLNTTNFTWQKLNPAFAITIQRMVYLTDFLGHKTVKKMSVLYVTTSFTSVFSTKKVPFSFNTWVHFSSNKTVSETVTTTYWDKWSRCKNSLELLFSIPKCKVFSYDGINVVKRGWYVTTRATPVSFILGLSNNSSKHFSETLLSWVSTTFCGYHLIQNQVFKVFLES